eukprot:6350510-Lingulodinium_polyedra.AAC.1
MLLPVSCHAPAMLLPCRGCALAMPVPRSAFVLRVARRSQERGENQATTWLYHGKRHGQSMASAWQEEHGKRVARA